MPVGIFAEGCVSNGNYIMPLKKGAFESGKSIRPVSIWYDWDLVNPMFCPVLIFPFLILHMSLLWEATANLTHMPIFVPNEYLYKTHADKGKERWEIVAWAIRDIIAKDLGLKLCDTSIRHGYNYARKILGKPPLDSPEE